MNRVMQSLPVLLMIVVIAMAGYIAVLQNKVNKLELKQSGSQSQIAAALQQFTEKVSSYESDMANTSSGSEDKIDAVDKKVGELTGKVAAMDTAFDTKIDQKMVARDANLDKKISAAITEAITQLKFDLSKQGINLNTGR